MGDSIDTDAITNACFLVNACFLIVPTRPLLHSISGNYIGDEGVTKLAAVLKETKICELKCAAAP